jgi:hypothetical protein
MEGHIKSLHEHHVNLGKTIASEILTCDNINPDLLQLIVKYKIFFRAESQWMAKSHSAHVSKRLNEASVLINKALLLLWHKMFDLSPNPSLSRTYANILHHFFYSRISTGDITYKHLHRLMHETQDVLSKIADEKTCSEQVNNLNGR